MSRFQMQSWGHDAGWKPMEDGAAPKVWRPRKTIEEAIEKCKAWAGLGDVCIPTMQVVDLETGRVEWRSGSYEGEVWPRVVAMIEEATSRDLPPPTDGGSVQLVLDVG